MTKKIRIRCAGYVPVNPVDVATWGHDCALCGWPKGHHR